MHDALKRRLEIAATRYDRRMSARKGHNHHALAIILLRIDDAMARIIAGETPEQVISDEFNDRLRDHLLKAITV